MTKRTEQKQKPSESHPLKGILNSNDDPLACAACTQPLNLRGENDDYARVECCGKWTCLECKPTLSFTRRGTDCRFDCRFCSRPVRSATEMFARIKKDAKKGHAWAQFELGDSYYAGDLVKRSHSDAFRWFSKASKQNHPQAHKRPGIMLMEGDGVAVDLAKAHHHFESAMSFGSGVLVVEEYRMFLAYLASRYMVVDATVAKSILDPLIDTRRGGGLSDGIALTCRGNMYMFTGDYTMAGCMYNDAILNGTKHGLDVTASSMCAFICAQEVGNVAQAAYWMKGIKISNIDIDHRREAIERLINFRQDYRALRDICGGCGIEFEGKERKFCRGCRTSCYCSRECQKMHWNRKNDGHREDCKGVTELKQKVKEAKRMSVLGK